MEEVVQVDLRVAVRSDDACEGAGEEDRRHDDQACDCKAVAEEALPRIRPLAARLDLEPVLVQPFRGGCAVRRTEQPTSGGCRGDRG